MKTSGELKASEAVMQIESSGLLVPKLLHQEAENELELDRVKLTVSGDELIKSTNTALSHLSFEQLMKLRADAKNQSK